MGLMCVALPPARRHLTCIIPSGSWIRGPGGGFQTHGRLPASRRILSLRGGEGDVGAEQVAGAVENCSCGGTAGDASHPRDAPGEHTYEEAMAKMVGAMVTVNLKMGPQVRGRLLSIDEQMNMVLGRPVEQWVNGTLASVDDADVFIRCHNVVDFGVVRGTDDPATVEILQDLGIRSGEGWEDQDPHS